MKLVTYIAVASALSFAVPVLAQSETPAAPVASVKAGAKIYSSDGRSIGRVERVNSAKDGTPTTVSVIYQSKFVYVPVSSLSASDKGFTSSLSRAEIAAGK